MLPSIVLLVTNRYEYISADEKRLRGYFRDYCIVE